MNDIILPCPKCLKTPTLCVCQWITPIKLKTKVLILQHPQEPDKDLGSAQMAHLCLEGSKLKVGLSWASLKKVLGNDANPKEWLVLFLGTAKVKAGLTDWKSPLVLVDKKGNPLEEQKRLLRGIKGLVVLDGNWSQAKTLWWRNPWMLKLQRGVLLPKEKSLYGRLRREPRRESLSTIESIALALSVLEPANKLQDPLLEPFKNLLKLWTSSN